MSVYTIRCGCVCVCVCVSACMFFLYFQEVIYFDIVDARSIWDTTVYSTSSGWVRACPRVVLVLFTLSLSLGGHLRCLICSTRYGSGWCCAHTALTACSRFIAHVFPKTEPRTHYPLPISLHNDTNWLALVLFMCTVRHGNVRW